MSKYRHLQSLAVAVVLLWSAGPLSADEPTSFTVVLLPDTQNYSERYPETYMAQTRWIKSRAKQDNVKFVIHLGDVVQTAEIEKEWENADRAHKILDGVVPYSMVPGNHDMDRKGNKRTRGTKLYNKYFPPARFEKYPWYGGHKDDDNTNNYCFFEGGGMKFMVLSLEFAPSDETLEWASSVVKKHKDRRVIVATHYHLRLDGRSRDTKPYGINGNVGEKLWNNFIRKHENVHMVFCGHVGGVYHQTAVNDAGGKVHEILCDYQGLPNGGDGWLQYLQFRPGENNVEVVSYSPKLDKYNKNPNHTYTLDYDMGLAKRRKAG